MRRWEETVILVRRAGRWLLAAPLRRPWLSPAVIIVLVAGAGYLGPSWFRWTSVASAAVVFGTVVGLAFVGYRARWQAAAVAKPVPEKLAVENTGPVSPTGR